ncbi:class C sortase [Actinomyces timonensis]|uniref:Class C sortase n=1 Tax=Actinomyces timonensis TaxID=1288391 RepID=A0AAU8N4J1_9ACTO
MSIDLDAPTALRSAEPEVSRPSRWPGRPLKEQMTGGAPDAGLLEAIDAAEAPGSADAVEVSSHSRRRHGKRWDPRRLMTALPVLLVLIGVGVLIYPVVATQHNNADQQRLAEMYASHVEESGEDVIAQQRAAAEEYNAHRESSPVLDPWLESQRPDTPQYQEYLSQLNLDEAMGRIVIPSIHSDLPIYHGTQSDTLAKGVGHLFGTSLPIGGASTHSVLTGHTGLGTATLFDHLTDLKKGDSFYVFVLGKTLKYEVADIRVVLPSETESLNQVPGRDLVTLITCTPYGVNTHRLLVTGERVPMDPVTADAEIAGATPAPMETWQVIIIWVVAIILTILALSIATALRRRRRCPTDSSA